MWQGIKTERQKKNNTSLLSAAVVTEVKDLIIFFLNCVILPGVGKLDISQKMLDSPTQSYISNKANKV